MSSTQVKDGKGCPYQLPELLGVLRDLKGKTRIKIGHVVVDEEQKSLWIMFFFEDLGEIDESTLEVQWKTRGKWRVLFVSSGTSLGENFFDRRNMLVKDTSISVNSNKEVLVLGRNGFFSTEL